MHEIELIKILAFGLLIALAFGYLTQKIRLSPIVGYLVAGFIVGPHFPGYTADAEIASQLAETGVILLMFGVGLHFNLKELIAVKNIALFGALVQSVATTAIATITAMWFGLSFASGLVIGMGLSVASTVVLLKMLEDNGLVETKQGHIVIGWLIAEDILTILALVVLPTLVKADMGYAQFAGTVALALGKVLLFSVITLLLGGKIIPWILTQVARTRSRELFTLTILAVAFSIATVASIYFGVSFALGAFLAGMVVGNTSLNSEATANILPMRDAFSVIFFLSVGMLVDPVFISQNIWFVLACLGIVLFVKSISAFVLVLGLGYPVRVALTAAVALSQIGEFSFILAQESQSLGIISKDAYSVIIGCAIASISVNPVLFRLIPSVEQSLMKRKSLWKFLNRKSEQKNHEVMVQSEEVRIQQPSDTILVGFGPIGKRIFEELQMQQVTPVVIDLNINTIDELTRRNIPAVYGDAVRKDILIDAGLKTADRIFITLPDVNNTVDVVSAVMKVNKAVKIYSRVRYKGSEEILKGMGVQAVFVEEDAVSAMMVSQLRDSH